MEENGHDRIFSAFMRMRKSIVSIHSGQLTNSMITAMLAIESNGEEMGAAPTAIGKCIGISMPAIARTIKELELRGYAVREQDKNDRRVFYVKLTDSGKDELHNGRKRIGARINRMLELLGEEDTEKMLELFDKLSVIAEQVKQEDENR